MIGPCAAEMMLEASLVMVALLLKSMFMSLALVLSRSLGLAASALTPMRSSLRGLAAHRIIRIVLVTTFIDVAVDLIVVTVGVDFLSAALSFTLLTHVGLMEVVMLWDSGSLLPEWLIDIDGGAGPY